MGGACCVGPVVTVEGSVVQEVDQDFPDEQALRARVPAVFATETELEFKQFHRGFKVEPTPLCRRLFDVFDEDNRCPRCQRDTCILNLTHLC